MRGVNAACTTHMPPKTTAASRSTIRIRPRAKEGFLFGAADMVRTSFQSEDLRDDPVFRLDGQNAQDTLVDAGLQKRPVSDGGLDGVERGL